MHRLCFENSLRRTGPQRHVRLPAKHLRNVMTNTQGFVPRCRVVIPWSVCRVFREPPLISLPKVKLLCCCASSIPFLLVVFCLH